MVSRFASAGLTVTTLPQVSVVSGFGSSCSQPTLENCPSQIVGSGLKTMSRPLPAGCSLLALPDGVALTSAHSALDKAIMKRLLPARVEIAAERCPPGFAHGRIGGRIDLAEQHGHDLMHASDIVERRNCRLDDRRRAIDGACVAPALQRMRQAAIAIRRARQSHRDAGRDAGSNAPASAHRRTEAGRRRIGRIAIENHERLAPCRRACRRRGRQARPHRLDLSPVGRTSATALFSASLMRATQIAVPTSPYEPDVTSARDLAALEALAASSIQPCSAGVRSPLAAPLIPSLAANASARTAMREASAISLAPAIAPVAAGTLSAA